MTILMSFPVVPHSTTPEEIAPEEVRNKAICPECGEEIDALIRVYEIIVTETVIWVDDELEGDITDEEEPDSGFEEWYCPECGERLAYTLEESEELMGVSH